jgi:carbonic anhydrase
MKPEIMLEEMKKRGISEETLETLEYSGIDVNGWLKGFEDVKESVAHSVDMINNHPLMTKEIPVHGLVIDPATGKLDLVINGYES